MSTDARICPTTVDTIAKLVLDILRRPNSILGSKPLFEQMGFVLDAPDRRQGTIRLYLKPDPAPQTFPMIKKDIERRIPKGMVFSGDVVTLEGVRRRVWIDVTDEKMQQMVKSVDGLHVICMIGLLLFLLYLVYGILDLNANLIL